MLTSGKRYLAGGWRKYSTDEYMEERRANKQFGGIKMHAYHISQTFRVIIKSYGPFSNETQYALEIDLLLSQMNPK